MKVAFLTAGGIAPCLSASIGALIESYNELIPDAEIIGYLNGYKGLLLGDSYKFPDKVKDDVSIFYKFGGSPIGNSRVKLTNVEDCIKRNLVKEGQSPLKVCADQLVKDGVNILHTIGGDDTNTTAADLSEYLKNNDYKLTVVGMPKTVDNDVFPIKQTLGAWTASEQTSLFFKNIANENTTSCRQLIIHEVMGRNCGWLTAHSAYEYHESLKKDYQWMDEALFIKNRWDISAVWIPELKLDLNSEIDRLLKHMDKYDSVNIFISEGAGVDEVIEELKEQGKEPDKDAFGHYRLDDVNVSKWFGKKLEDKLKADKVLIQKSGYFARSAVPNSKDLSLIKESANCASKAACEEKSGVVGLDEDNNNQMSVIEFYRIKGGKDFDTNEVWFNQFLFEIGQPRYS